MVLPRKRLIQATTGRGKLRPIQIRTPPLSGQAPPFRMTSSQIRQNQSPESLALFWLRVRAASFRRFVSIGWILPAILDCGRHPILLQHAVPTTARMIVPSYRNRMQTGLLAFVGDSAKNGTRVKGPFTLLSSNASRQPAPMLSVVPATVETNEIQSIFRAPFNAW